MAALEEGRAKLLTTTIIAQLQLKPKGKKKEKKLYEVNQPVTTCASKLDWITQRLTCRLCVCKTFTGCLFLQISKSSI